MIQLQDVQFSMRRRMQRTGGNPASLQQPQLNPCLDAVVGAIIVLVHGLQPAGVIVGMAHNVHIEAARVARCTRAVAQGAFSCARRDRR